MPMPSTYDAEALVSIRGEMGAIAGVDRVFLDGDTVVLLCDSQAVVPSALSSARQWAEARGFGGIEVTAVVRPDAVARERVRFDSVERIEERDMRVRIRVTLEWKGREVAGEAVGEKGETLELRTAAAAALAALAEIADPPLNLRLAGIKPIRAFDAELMVVSLYRPNVARTLLGAVLVAGDPRRAAAQAVLHALNRILGNFLAT